MRKFGWIGFVSASLLLLATGAVARSQMIGAGTGTDPAIVVLPPDAGLTADKVTLPSHHRGPENRLLYGRVRNGTYTVDGMIAKLRLNYDVDGVRFLYFFVPGVGTAVVSAAPDPDAVAIKTDLHENELTLAVGEHSLRLSGVALASDRGGTPAHLYVRLDRAAWQLAKAPMIGFGDVPAQPYAWPGTRQPETAKKADEAPLAPAVPKVLLPSTTTLAPRASAQAAPQPVPMP